MSDQENVGCCELRPGFRIGYYVTVVALVNVINVMIEASMGPIFTELLLLDDGLIDQENVSNFAAGLTGSYYVASIIGLLCTGRLLETYKIKFSLNVVIVGNIIGNIIASIGYSNYWVLLLGRIINGFSNSSMVSQLWLKRVAMKWGWNRAETVLQTIVYTLTFMTGYALGAITTGLLNTALEGDTVRVWVYVNIITGGSMVVLLTASTFVTSMQVDGESNRRPTPRVFRSFPSWAKIDSKMSMPNGISSGSSSESGSDAGQPLERRTYKVRHLVSRFVIEIMVGYGESYIYGLANVVFAQVYELTPETIGIIQIIFGATEGVGALVLYLFIDYSVRYQFSYYSMIAILATQAGIYAAIVGISGESDTPAPIVPLVALLSCGRVTMTTMFAIVRQTGGDRIPVDRQGEGAKQQSCMFIGIAIGGGVSVAMYNVNDVTSIRDVYIGLAVGTGITLVTALFAPWIDDFYDDWGREYKMRGGTLDEYRTYLLSKGSLAPKDRVPKPVIA